MPSTIAPDFKPGIYVVTFERIGRERPRPLETSATDGPDLADAVYRYARKYVSSRELDVDVRFDGTGLLTVGGFRSAGDFTWQRTADLP